MGHPVQQIAYKCCIHFSKNEFRVPNIVFNHWKIHSRSDFQDAINSTRRSTNDGDGATPMTSVFYDVIHLDSVRSFGKFEPQNVVGHRVNPKRHFLMLQCMF